MREFPQGHREIAQRSRRKLFEIYLDYNSNENIIRRDCCEFQAGSPLEMPDPRANDELESVLIQRIGDGDRDAFKEFYGLYHRRVFAYLTKLLSEQQTVEEVFNDVMFEVWRQAKTFRRESKVATWVFGIAHNLGLNAVRARRGTVVDLEETDETQISDSSTQALAEQSNLTEKIRGAMMRLSNEHRAVIELTFYHGFSYAEIARIVNCPVNTVKTRMFHARRQLRELLSKIGLQKGLS